MREREEDAGAADDLVKKVCFQSWQGRHCGAKEPQS